MDWGEIRDNLESTSWNVQETSEDSGVLEVNGVNNVLTKLGQVASLLTSELVAADTTDELFKIRVSVSPEKTTIEITKEMGREDTLKWTTIS